MMTAEMINSQENESQPSKSLFSVIVDAEIGEGTVVRDNVNLYRRKIGRNCKIESFVYIEEGVTIGNDCEIKPRVCIPTGAVIEDEVFFGPNVTFANGLVNQARAFIRTLIS